ncbi:AMP-binding protein [Jiangella mangrovi]|uniref:Acyl-CoA synthetase (AMP-forming)/AMP-acid ligase II n=1 Tax=Jiangella mangrovi TaxID=1524084 RepID=A0A7W9GRD6_9ACTN|nr:AMP-binding protein [Jiangella mangrovi]MBB5788630.1 acyl-CoA synthetase (AMP-forming)/AMP-acid ligase II [Jiangella mangrovi]
MPVFREVMAHAADHPHRVAVRCGDAVRTYAQLAAGAEAARPDVKPGALVPLTGDDPLDLLTGLLAADGAGAVPLVCDPAWRPEHRRAMLGALPATVDAAAAHDLAWAGFTSGSTGRPRVVVRSRSSWTGSFAATDRLTWISADDTVLVPGSLSWSLTAFGAAHALAAGATVLLTGDWSVPALRAAAPSADVAHLVPHRLATVLEAAGGRGRLRTAMVGGAALGTALRDRAAASGVGVVAYYGATELSFVAVDPDGTGLRPFDGVEIELRAGEVWVRSPWLAHGYLGDGGPLRRDDDGWATVGDLASTDGEGPLVLRGRGDGAVLTGGATVVPEDVEAVLTTVPGVDGVVVIGLPHAGLGEVVAAVVQGSEVTRATLEAVARHRLAPAQRPRRWLAVDELPRTSAGKPARALIATGVVDGALPTRPLP